LAFLVIYCDVIDLLYCISMTRAELCEGSLLPKGQRMAELAAHLLRAPCMILFWDFGAI